MAKTKQITDAPKKKAPKKTVLKSNIEVPIMVNLDLNYIKLDPNNPRKHFDESEMDELIESVRKNGVIQPIVVRPLGDDYHYIIIAGERRYRAAAAVAIGYKDRMSIPAVIKTSVTEEEARELQIVENIQRADMHPMEEAEAFQELSHRNLSPEEIGAKVGKSVYYVRRRLKLISLEPEWVFPYRIGHLSHGDALKLASLAPDSQRNLFKDKYKEKELILEKYMLRDLQHKLSDAKFDQDADYEGLPKCGNCPYNSAYNSLFPEEEKNAYCKNDKCFGLKKAYAFDLAFSNVKDDPGTVLIGTSYDVQKEEREYWKKNALDVYRNYSFNELEAPDPEDYDLDPSQYEPDEADELKLEQERYQRDLKEYQEDIKKPNLLKALVMNGPNKGEILYGFMDSNPELLTGDAKAGTNKSSIKSEDPDKEVKDEIERIEAKEKRSQELDAEKVWAKIAELVNDKENREKIFNSKELTPVELYAAASALAKKVSWDKREWVEEFFQVTEDDEQTVPTTVTKHALNGLLRLFICDAMISNYGSHQKEGSDNEIAFMVLNKYFENKIQIMEAEQKEISDKRQARVNERVTALKKKLNK